MSEFQDLEALRQRLLDSMEADIIIVTDHIEIHPAHGRHAVVRDGSVYGVYELDQATKVASELAGGIDDPL